MNKRISQPSSEHKPNTELPFSGHRCVHEDKVKWSSKGESPPMLELMLLYSSQPVNHLQESKRSLMLSLNSSSYASLLPPGHLNTSESGLLACDLRPFVCGKRLLIVHTIKLKCPSMTNLHASDLRPQQRSQSPLKMIHSFFQSVIEYFNRIPNYLHVVSSSEATKSQEVLPKLGDYEQVSATYTQVVTEVSDTSRGVSGPDGMILEDHAAQALGIEGEDTAESAESGGSRKGLAYRSRGSSGSQQRWQQRQQRSRNRHLTRLRRANIEKEQLEQLERAPGWSGSYEVVASNEDVALENEPSELRRLLQSDVKLGPLQHVTVTWFSSDKRSGESVVTESQSRHVRGLKKYTRYQRKPTLHEQQHAALVTALTAKHQQQMTTYARTANALVAANHAAAKQELHKGLADLAANPWQLLDGAHGRRLLRAEDSQFHPCMLTTSLVEKRWGKDALESEQEWFCCVVSEVDLLTGAISYMRTVEGGC
ncbi:hypothetical protein CEUSTIGMA_g736.t1 [Chlamydomonas eustigma]|uniref:Uncharacterized protein n=1 Tax=Chlamydomonas eustigma TaxID=1157962 RepID=A0A250WRI5_9CHLO|nr:hypothetical protein CEUSTIGMA_g736.t1 [Chlamydomonas eustigma]|eukprot:GAX73282.1 hypothetical protein CEUSTIGMA_g736.t1 [Chlamydomonas eustigma]